jgi:acetate kinase
MGTRSGRIDPSVIFHLVRELGYNIEEVSALLNKKSGMLGLAGHSDMRDVRKQLDAGDKNAMLAYDMYTYRIRKYIGAFQRCTEGPGYPRIYGRCW